VRRTTDKRPWVLAPAALLAVATEAAEFNLGDTQVNVGGYLRQYVSTNLSDNKDLRGDQQFDVSMLRSVLQLNADTQAGPFFVKAIGRSPASR